VRRKFSRRWKINEAAGYPVLNVRMREAGTGKSLAGKGIVVTRPVHQAAHLAGLIRAEGGNPLLFPVIEIVGLDDARPLLALIDRLDDFDWAIFVSPNAVSKALGLISARRALPARLRIAAVGRGSVRELNLCGVIEVIAPARFDSEALLDLPQMQDVAGKRIVVFRGDGGRELLGDTLAARGAIIEYAACYRRARPRTDAAPLLGAWARDELHAITVTSSEGLQNLCALVGAAGQLRLRKTPLFVPHPRIAETARELGLATVVVTAQGDDGIVQGLQQWFAAGK
jgi:uroporphyrinogen-III synthase